MDEVDRKLISELQLNSRIRNDQLADKVGVSPPTCLRRVKKLEEQKVITAYTARIDPEKCGFSLTALVAVKLINHQKETVKSFEKLVNESMPEVLECLLMAGDFDYMLKVMCADIKTFEAFVRGRLHSSGLIFSLSSNFSYGMIKSVPIILT